MTTGMATAEVTRLVGELGPVTEAARRSFGGLSVVQLNWKPAPTEWSIAQCLEHLMLINTPYIGIFERIARGEWRPTLKERLPFLPRLFGKLVLAVVQPDTKRKVKAAAAFLPSQSAIPADVVTRFAAHQAEVGRAMKAAASRDLARTIITSPVARFMTYSALDACRIVVTHEQHHMVQAERVLAGLRNSAWG